MRSVDIAHRLSDRVRLRTSGLLPVELARIVRRLRCTPGVIQASASPSGSVVVRFHADEVDADGLLRIAARAAEVA